MKHKIAVGLLLTVLPVFALADMLSPEQLFNTAGGYGCIACHGKYAHGGNYVGGNIRDSTREKLDIALETQPTMLLLAEVLDENKRNALMDHLASLSKMQLLEWRIGESTETKIVKAKASHSVQLVLFNGTFDTLSLDLSALGAEKNYLIDAYDTQAVTWTPQKTGRYQLFFNNEHFIIDVH
jgi:hypothetical protein